MYKLFVKPVSKAKADIKLPEPRVSRLMIFVLKLLGRLYLFLFYGVARIILRGEKELFEAFRRALAGESRCIIAFRHPNGGEPQLLSWFFLSRLRSLARRQGIDLGKQPHAVFVYGYEVVRWGGKIARLIMPRVGAMPIHHSKVDRQGMERIYRALMNGPYPLALSPEGQVSYTVESVPRLEQGTFRIGFNTADRLAARGSEIPVEVLPVAIHFRFGSWGKLTLKSLVRKIEKYTGTGGKEAEKLPLSRRFERCRERVLEVNEKRYHIAPDSDLSYESRLERIIAAALESAERILGEGKTEGELFARMYSLRQICWDRIILPGAESLDALSKLERGATDLLTGEAWHAGRHLELVDFALYFRGPVPEEEAPLHHQVEYAQNLWDFLSRTIGGAYANRINILPRRVIIQAAPVINISERLPAYRRDKRGSIEKAMADLKNAYMDCIARVNHSE